MFIGLRGSAASGPSDHIQPFGLLYSLHFLFVAIKALLEGKLQFCWCSIDAIKKSKSYLFVAVNTLVTLSLGPCE